MIFINSDSFVDFISAVCLNYYILIISWVIFIILIKIVYFVWVVFKVIKTCFYEIFIICFRLFQDLLLKNTSSFPRNISANICYWIITSMKNEILKWFKKRIIFIFNINEINKFISQQLLLNIWIFITKLLKICNICDNEYKLFYIF